MPKKQKKKFNARCADLLHLWFIESIGENPRNPDNALRMHVYLSKMFQAYVSFAFHLGDGPLQSDLAAMSSLTHLIESYHELLTGEELWETLFTKNGGLASILGLVYSVSTFVITDGRTVELDTPVETSGFFIS